MKTFAFALPNVRFWHKADITRLVPMPAFGGKADIARTHSDVRF